MERGVRFDPRTDFTASRPPIIGAMSAISMTINAIGAVNAPSRDSEGRPDD
jgi:hypothetical protein